MKPSQIANRLVAPPRRMLPLLSPDLCHGSPSPYEPSCCLMPVRSLESHRPEYRKWLSGLRLSPLQQPQPPVTVAKKHDGAQGGRPNISRDESPHPRKDLNTCYPSVHNGREHKSMAASSLGTSASVQRVQSTKELLSTPSSKKSIPVASLDHTLQKRRRECEDSDTSVKKPCVREEPPKPPPKSPSRTSPASLQPQIPKEQFASLGPSPKFKPDLLPSTRSKPDVRKRPFLGARQLFIHSIHGNVIQLGSFSKHTGDVFKTTSEEHDKREKANADPKRISPPHFSPPQQSQHGSSESESLRTLKRTFHDVHHESPSKFNSSPGPPPAKRKKLRRRRRTIPSDYDELFTPDVIVSSVPKTAKGRTDDETEKRPPGCGAAVQSSENSCRKGKDSGVAQETSSKHPHISLPSVSLVTLNSKSLKSTYGKGKDCSVPAPRRHSTHESLKHDDKNKARLPSTPRRSRTPPLNGSEGRVRPHTDQADSVDEDLDLSLGIAFDLESSQTSQSSEEEQLVSLQEIMNHVRKSPAAPDKGAAFSEPSTPGASSNPFKAPTVTRGYYRNSLDQMLKEIDNQKKAKENEAQLRSSCDEELSRVAEYQEEENRDEGSSERQEFLQRDSLESTAIREVPPGEAVFHLDKFGQIFNQDSLQLRRCAVKPQSTAQKTLLWSSSAQLKLHLIVGLFQKAYCSQSPCPPQITDFLFKMMSVHSERMLSEKMLQALCDIAGSAAYNIVKNKSCAYTVWVPALADLTLVLMNMGVAFVTLFPFENLQPAFTEGDLLKNVYVHSEGPPCNKECNTFPEHNCTNIFKYLSYCMSMCPKAYSDYELLLLLTVMARVALDAQFIPLAGVEINTLLTKIVSNIRDWDTMLPRMCQTLTDLTDDHHNMCLLVQLLPDNTRGKCLRQHLSLSMISKLLDGTSRYRPTGMEVKLAVLKPYVPAMQPSSLRRFMTTSSVSSTEEDVMLLDQQSYYLCYSLLTLTNEASNFHFFPTHQKEHLLTLCSDLRAHIMCHIRESEKCLYRSKVKDLLARIYTKWQMILQRIQPLHSKLCDYWKPSSVGSLTSRQKESEGSRERRTSGEKAEEEKAEEKVTKEEASKSSDNFSSHEEEGAEHNNNSNQSGARTTPQTHGQIVAIGLTHT
ncbi:SMC5-SMC6 complex localization factor protein 2 isoform X2 [Hippocampus zosterae]|nr:SMC5-SMC6 complex localization factor protein 2 isoform X2 [Hippocampus zosterae]XP_051935818.1 SMC5-SMC6 complex localization factor protein 2 isoform X2 [Hippocampus zosterae]XP_051935819.1 SMC5-SMC6 complex localization factor protein 2 isoform X2 [Hippocampus zosterae]